MDLQHISRAFPRRALGHPLTEDALIDALRKENANESGDGSPGLSLDELSAALSEQRDIRSLAQSFIDADDKSGFFGKLKKRHRQEVDKMAAHASESIATIEQRIAALNQNQPTQDGTEPELLSAF